MGQVESQPQFSVSSSDGEATNRLQSSGKKGPSPPQLPMHPRPRRHASSTHENDNASQATSRSFKSSRSPLSWAAAGVELVASATADVALTTMNAALKTASVLASTTEAAANAVASTTTNVALNTASVATQTASLITTATSAGAKTAGDAIAGTASLVVEGLSTATLQTGSPSAREGRTRSRSGESMGGLSPQHRSAFFVTTVGRPSQDFLLPEAMALGSTLSSTGSHDNLAEIEQKSSMRNVGSRFWCMVGATNISARKHWVATVTSSKPSAPSAKYLRKILTLAWESKGQSIDEYYKMLQVRPITTSPNCALKALITSLRIVREGPPEALATSIANVGIIDAMGASWAARVLVDVAPDDNASQTAASSVTSASASPTNKRSLSPHTATTIAASMVQNAVNKELMDQMLIARLSGLIVQKMHFHSRRHSLNARYETSSAPSPALSLTATGGKYAGDKFTKAEQEDDDDQQDVWEKNVQLCSSLLTLLGTIEGVARLGLGMGAGESDAVVETPSAATLSLCTLLIEEALSAFDALSVAMLEISSEHQPRDQDSTLVKSLMARYHEAYKGMRSYCSVALQHAYVVALNKVPLLSDEASPLERGMVYSRLQVGIPSNQPLSPTSPASTTSSERVVVGAAKPKQALSPSSASSSSSTQPHATSAPSLAARPFTRSSILETLEEEEALENRLVFNNVLKKEDVETEMTPVLGDHHTRQNRSSRNEAKRDDRMFQPANTSGMESRALLLSTTSSSSSYASESQTETPSGKHSRKINMTLPPPLEDLPDAYAEGNERFLMSMFNPWEYNSNSVEHARPPAQFCVDAEEDEDMSDFDLANDVGDENDDQARRRDGEEDVYNGKDLDFLSEGTSSEEEAKATQSEVDGKVIRVKTTGNPFDTGNSSIILLAEAHRSAFSTISNPFASGQFNAFATNQVLSKHHVAMGSTFQQQPIQSPPPPAAAAAQQQQQQKQQPQQPFVSQKHREEATKRALQQCERLFEFSGIKINQEDLVISADVLGRGAFSVVRRGRVKPTGEEVAVKELLIEEWGRSPETILDFRAEVAVMKAVHHPNVLQLIGACTSPNLCLISEFCDRGNLFDLLYADRAAAPTSSRVLGWQLRLRMAIGEARGMYFLHTAFPAPLIHRDLKSLNLLLSKNWTLKVSDFGLARFRRRNGAEGPCGTTQWMAPEVIVGKNYDETADVYSFGVNLWELCTRRVPWEGVAPNQVKQHVVRGERPAVGPNVLDLGCPPQLVDLMQRCWSQKPGDRPDFGTIVNELKVIAKSL